MIQGLNEARGNDRIAGLAESSALSDIALENSRSMMAYGKLDQSKVKALIPQKRLRLKYVQAADARIRRSRRRPRRWPKL